VTDTARREVPEQSEHPTFTNAHAQMCAVITAVTNAWGDEGQALLRRTYRELGHRTGEQMIRTGIVPAGADLETYGRVSEQIMDTCGLEGWTRVPTSREEHRTIVPGCADYLPLFEFLEAPDNVCSLPFEWDNGCLDVINADLQIWPTTCVYRSESQCHYVISHREETTRPETPTVPTTRAGERVAVRNEPTWTNPTAGFLALIGSTSLHYPEEGLEVLRPALRALGARAGQDELAGADQTVESVAETLVRRYRAAGFVDAELQPQADGRVLVDLGGNPYGPVLDHFSSHQAASELFHEYDAGWSSAAPDVAITTVKDGWLDASSHVLSVASVR
jgi:hypothetical protein